VLPNDVEAQLQNLSVSRYLCGVNIFSEGLFQFTANLSHTLDIIFDIIF